MINSPLQDLAGQSDPRLFALIPHRPPMLLIEHIVEVNERSATALVTIGEKSPFYRSGLGVPSWIGLEYMGQTAALIGGFLLQQGALAAHMGFLLGTRSYQVETAYFPLNCQLSIHCEERAAGSSGLAQFDCTIRNHSDQAQLMARATLSVFRKTGLN